MSGIYQIICIANGKYYVGSSNNLLKRKSKHWCLLKNNKHDNIKMQASWNKYGADSFIIFFIEEIPEHLLLLSEQQYLNQAQLHTDQCFNLTFIAGQPPTLKGENHPNWGKPMSAEHKEHLRKINTGKHHSEHTKHKMSIAKLNFKPTVTPESIRKRLITLNNNGKIKGANNSAFDHTIYKFKNIITEKIFEGNRFNFYNKFNLNRPHVCALIKGKRPIHKNWVLIS